MNWTKSTVMSTTLLLFTTALLAQSALDGKWVVNFEKSKFPEAPIMYEVKGGIYQCQSCKPVLKCPADGKDYPVPDSKVGETIAVEVLDSHTVNTIFKTKGKPTAERLKSVSPDAKTMTVKQIVYTLEGKPEKTADLVMNRTAPGAPGSHAISGTWVLDQAASHAAPVIYEFHTGSDGTLHETSPFSECAIRLDGKKYPCKSADGIPTFTSMRPTGPDTYEQVDWSEGKITDVSVIRLSSDHRTMTTVFQDKTYNTTTTYVMEKQ